MKLLFDVGDDALLAQIAYYLDFQDVANFLMTCKRMYVSKDRVQFDKVWDALCLRRWRFSTRTMNIFRIMHKRLLCASLAKNLTIPEGKYTGKSNYVFGSGQHNGLAAWLMIGHNTANANLREVPSMQMNKIEIRFCLQNLSRTDVYKIPFKSTMAHITCAKSEDIKDGHLESNEFRALTHNGVILDAQKALTQQDFLLGHYDYAVMKSTVYCPMTVESELDFLLLIQQLQLTMKQCVVMHTSHSSRSENTVEARVEEVTIPITMLSEDMLVSFYQQLPRGLVMLKDKPVHEIMYYI